jgi:hypothetical protein
MENGMSTLAIRGVESKGPNESKLYTMDWSGSLASGVTISSSTWVVQGVTKAADSIVDGNVSTSILIEDGIEGQHALCTNTVVTSDGQTLERTGEVAILKR